MSASSSSTNTTANTGPSRFRRDAASFSPSQHSPSLINQQMFQQQVQQQQMYAPYMYSGGGPMMPNQFYQYIPHYIIPTGAGGQYHPDTGYYPYGNYSQIPPPHVAYAPAMNPMSMAGAGGYQHRAKGTPKRTAPNASSNTNQTSSYHASPVSQNAASPNVDKASPRKESEKIESSGGTKPDNKEDYTQDNTGTINPSSKSADVGKSGNERISDKPLLSFPLVINTTVAEFKEKQSANKTREENVKAKKERLNKFVQSKRNDKNVLISLQKTKVINCNTNTVIIKNENFNEIDENIPDNDNSHENNLHNLKNKRALHSAQESNWASILQSSQSLKKQPTKTKSSTQSPNPASSTISPSIASQAVQQLSVEAKSGKATEIYDFKMENESSQPLGVLLLKIVFDPNYNIFSSNSQVPFFKLKPRGLTNTGNICYMNSILQVLIYCEPFNKLLKLIESKSIGSLGSDSPTPLVDATISFIKEFTTNNNVNKYISTESFYMNLIAHEKFSHLKWGQQEDAEEFLGYFLDGLNEEFTKAIKDLKTPHIDSMIQSFSNSCSDPAEVNKFKTNIKNAIKLFKKSDEDVSEKESNNNEWSEIGANNKKISVRQAVEVEPTPISMIFGGQFKSVLTTPKMSNSSQISITLDPFQNIQLDISESDSIEDALVHLNNVESISYKNSNNSEISLKKQTFIDRLPPVLVIHMKRFSYLKDQERGIEKLRKKVAYGHSLTIPQEVLSSPDKSEYKLIGVVYHHGSSADGGHYTSDVLKSAAFCAQDDSSSSSPSTAKSEEWIRIDDTSVKTTEEDTVLGGGPEDNVKCAYILFYQKT